MFTAPRHTPSATPSLDAEQLVPRVEQLRHQLVIYVPGERGGETPAQRSIISGVHSTTAAQHDDIVHVVLQGRALVERMVGRFPNQVKRTRRRAVGFAYRGRRDLIKMRHGLLQARITHGGYCRVQLFVCHVHRVQKLRLHPLWHDKRAAVQMSERTRVAWTEAHTTQVVANVFQFVVAEAAQDVAGADPERPAKRGLQVLDPFTCQQPGKSWGCHVRPHGHVVAS